MRQTNEQRNSRAGMVALGVLTILAASTASRAESTPKPAPVGKSADPAVKLGTLTVTDRTMSEASSGYSVFKSSAATKTDTPIMETPISIQVVPREVMDDQKAVRITDALENVSGVRPQPTLGLGSSFIIRGFRNGNVYRNGLRTHGFPSDFDTANLQSVEVLKGPAQQYGRIEPGGLVNITTKKPLDTPFYSLEQRFGSYDFYRTEWDASGPVNGDKSLLYRFSGAYQDNNSFRDFISEDRLLVSPSVTWKPTDATDFTVNIEGFDKHFQADFGIPVVGKRPVNIPVSRAFGDPNDPMDSQSKVLLGTELNHRFNDDWAIHNRFLANYDYSKTTFVNPAPAFGGALGGDNRTLGRNIFMQEDTGERYATNLDLTGKFYIGPTKHETLMGFDYYRSFTNYHWQGFYDSPNPALAIDIYNPSPSYGINRSLFKTALNSVEFPGRNFSIFKDEWKAVYFQDQITLWDKLHVMGGGRYDWAETGRGRGGSFGQAENSLTSSTNTRIRKDEGFSPRVGILYQPWNWLGVYGNWTTSFGANNGISSAGTSFTPEIGEQFEAGIKTSLFDQRLLATLAYFHLTKNNMITPDLTTADPNDSAAIGQARSQGIELDVTGHVTDTLSVVGSYAFTDARITLDNSGNKGKRLNNVPEQSGSLWLKYDVNGHEAKNGLSFGVGSVVAGQREGDVANSFQLPGYARMDAFAAYRLKVGPTRVTTQINIRNLLDKKYYESTDPDSNVSPRLGVYAAAPLMAMGSVRVEF